jgi:hypothetical protein
MTLKATVSPRVTNQTVVLNQKNGILTTVAGVTLKNQISELSSIEQINDVTGVNVTNGATLVYNSTNDKYEVKPLEFSSISGSLDGGTF